MRETRLYGSEGGAGKAFPTPIRMKLVPVKTGNGEKKFLRNTIEKM